MSYAVSVTAPRDSTCSGVNFTSFISRLPELSGSFVKVILTLSFWGAEYVEFRVRPVKVQGEISATSGVAAGVASS